VKSSGSDVKSTGQVRASASGSARNRDPGAFSVTMPTSKAGAHCDATRLLGCSRAAGAWSGLAFFRRGGARTFMAEAHTWSPQMASCHQSPTVGSISSNAYIADTNVPDEEDTEKQAEVATQRVGLVTREWHQPYTGGYTAATCSRLPMRRVASARPGTLILW
jgi:hypothetical protein